MRKFYDPMGHTNAQTFDAAGQLTSERHADGGVLSYAYNAFGDKTRKTDALGNVNTYSYDKLSRLLQTAYASANVYTVTAANTLSFVANRPITQTTTWDQAGRQLSQTNGNGETIRYTFDLIGNVLQTLYPLSGSPKAVFDAQHRKVAEADANGNGNASLWRYDYFGQLTSHIDLGNNRTSYTHYGTQVTLSLGAAPIIG